MATLPKTARLVAAEVVGPRARRLEYEMLDQPLGFVGGQYIIVDSGVVLEGGKIAKRAYSILSTDREQMRFELVVRRLDPGPCSNYMHEHDLGATLKFSGPWGKLIATGDESDSSTLVVATDTGITAAIGLLKGAAFQRHLATTTLLWLTTSESDFVTESFVRERVLGGALHVAPFPAVEHPERAAAARDALRHFDVPERAYLAGDGRAVIAMSDSLVAAGVSTSRIAVECFFNNPLRRAT